jgi:hypothetical protein
VSNQAQPLVLALSEAMRRELGGEISSERQRRLTVGSHRYEVERPTDLRASTGIRHGTDLLVLTLTSDRICSVIRFDTSVLPWRRQPRSLLNR